MKTKTILWAAPMAALLLFAAAAPLAGARTPVEPDQPKEKAPKACFWPRMANGFAAVDEHFVNIRVGVKDVYQFEMFGPCLDVDWNHEIALVSRGGSSMICTGFDAEIVTRSSIGPQRCAVRAVRKLTPAEVAALPKGAKP